MSEISADTDDTNLYAMKKQGLSVRDIAERTGMPKSTVGRKVKAFET